MENKNQIPEIDPKKLFDEENYSTIVIKNNETEEPIENKKKSKPDLSKTILALLEADKTELLKTLKNIKAQDTIIELIKTSNNKNLLPKLVALCWESGLDFEKQCNLFFDLSVGDDIYVSIEALTVLENIEKYNSLKELEEGIDKLKKAITSNHSNKIMIEETRLQLFEKLKSLEEKS
jgi:hypothetical protein